MGQAIEETLANPGKVVQSVSDCSRIEKRLRSRISINSGGKGEIYEY